MTRDKDYKDYIRRGNGIQSWEIKKGCAEKNNGARTRKTGLMTIVLIYIYMHASGAWSRHKAYCEMTRDTDDYQDYIRQDNGI
jgi:hypothetical protein